MLGSAMGVLRRRQPNVRRLQRAQDLEGLARALEYREIVSDRDGRRVDRGARVRGEVVEVVAEWQDPRAVEVLVRGLRDDTSYVRLKAIEAVRGRRDDRVLEALAEGVGALRTVPDAAALRGQLHSLDPVRAKALDALVELADPRAPERIAAHMVHRAGDEPLTETDESAFRAALAAVPDGGGPQLAASIAALLGHERPEVRTRAQAVLRWIGPASVEPLIAALRQPHLRGLAIAPLGELGDARAAQPLLDTLSDHDPAIRSAAARALGELRHPSCVEGLMLATHDDDHGVRTEAIGALEQLGTAAVIVAMHDVFEPMLLQLQGIARSMAIEARAREASFPRHEPSRPGLAAGETEAGATPWRGEDEESERESDPETPPEAGRGTTASPGATSASPEPTAASADPGTASPRATPSPDGEPKWSLGRRIRSQLRRRLLA
jgi:HEAT repeat protein